MQPVMVRKFKTLAVICCFFSLAGVIYQLVDLKYIDYKSIAIFMIKNRINEKRSAYMKEFGVVPQFKAGVHYGKVTSAQIGDIKREIIYNGDVLNTTARIQEQCNKVKRELLTSGSLLERLDLSYRWEAEKIETVKLRGKESYVELYSVNCDSHG